MAWASRGTFQPDQDGSPCRGPGLADRSAIASGEPFNLLVSLKTEKDWHVYWRSSGGLSGIPTTIRVDTGPPGFEFGRALFPVPKKSFDAMLNETSFILEGEPLFVIPVRVLKIGEAGVDATFKAKIAYLACKKECIPGEVELAPLPVVAQGDRGQPRERRSCSRAAATSRSRSKRPSTSLSPHRQINRQTRREVHRRPPPSNFRGHRYSPTNPRARNSSPPYSSRSRPMCLRVRRDRIPAARVTNRQNARQTQRVHRNVRIENPGDGLGEA